MNFLRVNDPKSGYGSGNDFLDAEVIIRLDTESGKAFGFQLRDDDKRPAHEAMFNLLLDAFKNDWTVNINYWIAPGSSNGAVNRVWLTR